MNRARGRRKPASGAVWMTRFDDPPFGVEIGKRRPAVIVTPAWLHQRVRTVGVVPLTSVRRGLRTRVPTTFQGVAGEAAADQARIVDRDRLLFPMGTLDAADFDAVLAKLRELFTPPPTSPPPRTPAAGRRP